MTSGLGGEEGAGDPFLSSLARLRATSCKSEQLLALDSVFCHLSSVSPTVIFHYCSIILFRETEMLPMSLNKYMSAFSRFDIKRS